MPYKYSDYYNSYKKANYWRDVKKVGTNNVNSGTAAGRAVWNTSGTYGPGIVSESMGYAMMLAALYDDKETFDQLSATVQAAIEGSTTPLMPWYLTEEQTNEFTIEDTNSASDGDINIALAYVYADQAASVYGWDDSTPNNELYHTLASDYIAAIRQYDFSQNDSNNANNYIIQDGFEQAKNGFSSENWHPDYSDPRAYQLFELYDTTGAAFWGLAQDYTKEAWKAVFNFGANDTGRSENAATGLINSSSSYVNISNPTYDKLKASGLYTGFTFNRPESGSEYDSDSSRLPMRILNYINAEENTGDAEIIGVANANLTALNQVFKGPNSDFWYIKDKIKIAPPYSTDSDHTQNFTAAGLLALAGSKHLSVADTQKTVENLNTEFGTTGINGANVSSDGGWAINPDTKGEDVFNDALTLWGLSTYEAANIDLLDHVNSIKSFDPITGNLMLGETGKEDVFVFSKDYFPTNGSDNLQEGGMVRIVGFNRKEDTLVFEAGKIKGKERAKIKKFGSNRKANKLIKKDTPFVLDRRTGELYATFIGSNSDRFKDLTPFAKFIDTQSSLGNVKADLILS